VGPSQEQAAILFDLAMMGDISGILEEIEKLEQADNQLAPFVRTVRKREFGVRNLFRCRWSTEFIPPIETE
jgi:hypothetical protein